MKCTTQVMIVVIIAALCLSFSIVPTVDAANTPPPEKQDDCEKCGPTRMIGCRRGRCYYKCTRRCLGKDNKFYYEALKFNFAGQ